MLVFAVETSCDETSICLMNNKNIVKHDIFSQKIHEKYGGVVPELASRSHLVNIQNMTQEMFSETNIDPKKIDIFAATCGPGLLGSLLVGSTFTKSLSISFDKPFVPINHLEGHVLSTSFNNDIEYPQLVLLLTGGHTQFYLMKNNKNIVLIGKTVDDALGEAFDKVAKILGLPYPGGNELEKKALEGNENFFDIPKPLINEDNLNFSFSGIKTYINLLSKRNNLDGNFISNVSASFQKTIGDILISKIQRALNKMQFEGHKIKSLSVVGGVSNNNYIKKRIENHFKEYEIKIFYPLQEMMGDNAAMIAWACICNYNENKIDVDFKVDPRLEIKVYD